jgi:hypothetical protein
MKKHLFIFLFMGLFSATLSSCSSSQTFTVQGIPGTVITNPSNKQLAVIDHSGQAKIKLKRKATTIICKHKHLAPTCKYRLLLTIKIVKELLERLAVALVFLVVQL